jgi:hypothetical protein
MPAQPRLSEDLRSYLYAEAGVRVTAESISLDDAVRMLMHSAQLRKY